MAKQNQEVRTDKGKLHFRVIEFDLEGGNESLQESLRTVAAAVSKIQNGVVTVSKPALAARVFERTVAAQQEAVNEEPEAVELSQEIEEQVESGDVGEVNKKKRSYPSPIVVELAVKAGAPQFDSYAEGFDTGNTQKKYLVCLGYLRQHTDHAEPTQDHVFTLFKFMKWSYGADFSQPLRTLKSLQYAVNPGGRGTFTLNHIGERELEKLSVTGK